MVIFNSIRSAIGCTSVMLACLLAWPAQGRAAGTTPRGFGTIIKPFLSEHCFECHDAESKKGDLQLDALAPDFSDKGNFATWERAYDKMMRGEMPPKKKTQPPAKQLKTVEDWLRANLHQASAARQATEGRVVYRRLNRVEYENTIHDLLGIDAPLKDLLPEDASAFGFDNIGAALDVSSVLMERYLEAADTAIDAALWHNSQPESSKERYSYKDETRLNSQFFGKRMLVRDDAVVFFMEDGFYPTELSQFRAPMDGRYRFRVSAYAYQSNGKTLPVGIHAGSVFGRNGEVRFLGCWDAPPDQPREFEFETRLERGQSIRVSYFNSGYTKIDDAAAYKGPGVAVQWVQAEGPLFDAWPSASYRSLFGDLPPQVKSPKYVPRTPNKNRSPSFSKFTVISAQPEQDAKRLLNDFTARAFRHPVSEAEVQPYLALVLTRLQQGYTFEEAMRVGFRGVLCAPDFLFLKEKPGKLDDYAVASRLSYFLWSSPPDAELLALAKAGKLSQPATLRAQTERLLNDPKAREFAQNFLGQWLDLRNIDFTTPDKKLYPEYDDLLKLSMVRETEAFFDELLKRDLSVQNFVQSDFMMVNGRLAELYHIPDINGQEMQKISVPVGSHRGGLLTQASVLKVTANGTTTSPVVRGKWVLDKIMGKPPEPPPKNVGAVEPDIRGTKTIRERLDKHRNVEACATCHTKIDPPGFALENFDVIGGWRDHYRSLGEGTRVNVEIHGRRVQYKQSQVVDASYTTADGRPFHDIDEFKALLLQNKEQTARCVTEKLLTYATGAGIQFADHAAVDEIIGKARARNYGLRTLVHEVVESKVFLNK